MRNSEQGDGAMLITVVIIGLVLLGGAGFILVRQRQQAMQLQREAMMQMERARAEASRADAIAQKQAAEQLAADTAEAGKIAATEGESLEAEIRGLLDRQTQAWNDANVDQFMECYQRTDELVVRWNEKVTRTWEDAKNELEENGFAEGELKLSSVSITRLAEDAASVVVDWQRDHDGGSNSGIATLTLRKVDNRWLVTHDHRSLSSESK